jgi:hypothetical protein
MIGYDQPGSLGGPRGTQHTKKTDVFAAGGCCLQFLSPFPQEWNDATLP